MATLSPVAAVNSFDRIAGIVEVDPSIIEHEKEKARKAYEAAPDVYCPYFGKRVILSSNGFHHLQYSGRQERSLPEQLSRLRLLPFGIQVIRKSGTAQEYRKVLIPIGKPKKDGFVPMKEVEYWSFVAILGEKQTRIRTIVRRVGAGELTFWSVMLISLTSEGKYEYYNGGIEDED